MRQIKTLITALTLVCIASVCLAGFVTFLLWREAGRVLSHGKPVPMSGHKTVLIAVPDRSEMS